jgi:hypothetical protein
MSGVQRFFMAVLPRRWAAGMEAESRTWIMRCGGCGAAASVWERGGIRWKASGSPRVRGKCTACGRNTTHTVTREGHGSVPPAGSR